MGNKTRSKRRMLLKGEHFNTKEKVRKKFIRQMHDFMSDDEFEEHYKRDKHEFIKDDCSIDITKMIEIEPDDTLYF